MSVLTSTEAIPKTTLIIVCPQVFIEPNDIKYTSIGEYIIINLYTLP